MNWLDFLLAGILVISTLAGFAKGFFRLGIGLVATIAAFLLASWFYIEAGAWAEPYTSSRGIAHFIGFLLIFLAVAIAGALLGRMMAKIFKWIGLSWLDRLGGGALGFLRGGLIALVIVLMVSSFLPGDPPQSIIASRITPHVLDGASVLSQLTPADMKQQFRQTYEKAKKAWVDPVRDRLHPLGEPLTQ